MKITAANAKTRDLIPVMLLMLWSEIGLVLGGFIGLLIQEPRRSLVRFLVRVYVFLFFPLFCLRLARLLLGGCKAVEIENDWIHFYYLEEMLHCRLGGLKVLVEWKRKTYVCTLDCYPIVINSSRSIVLCEIKNQNRA